MSSKDVSVYDEQGNVVPLLSLWTGRRIILVLLRHLGCRFCHQQWTQLGKTNEQLGQHDVTLVGIASGTREQIEAFRERTHRHGELYVVRERDALKQYVAYELFRVLRLKTREQFFGPATVAKAEQAAAQGFTDVPHLAGATDEWAGNTFQLGGVFVLGPGNTCSYSFRSAYAGDHPNIDDVLTHVTGVQASGESFFFPATKTWWERLQVGKPTAELSEAPKKPPSSPGPSQSYATLAGVPWMAWAVGAALVATLVGASLSPSTGLVVSRPVLRVGGLLLAAVLLYFTMSGGGKGKADPDADTDMDTNGHEKAVAANEEQTMRQSLSSTFTDGTPRVVLLPPAEIDDLVHEDGLVECDCGEVVERLPFVDGEAIDSVDSSRDTGNQKAPRPRSFSHSGDADRSKLKVAANMLCYLREFLARPHPDLGRKGPTCPFIPKALRIQSVYIAVTRPRSRHPTVDFIRQSVDLAMKQFSTLKPEDGTPLAIYKAMVLVFPDVELKDAPRLIDKVQCELKNDFVSRGLMIGEFHMLNNMCGLHNPHFYPLRTPFPSMAIRHMVPSDVAFLTGSQHHVECYLRLFGKDTKPSAQKHVAIAQQAMDKFLAQD
eukprot:m.174762 g.174762  ORF g.174762 m.174762 type:complete len:604 (-) comp17904_c1_seq1:49-1860(-)